MKKIIKAIIDDFKRDWDFLVSLNDGSYKAPAYLKNINWKKLVKDVFSDKMTYLAILLIVAAWMSGYIMSSVHFQNACNEFIFEQFYNNPQAQPLIGYINQSIFNFSHLK